MTQLDKPKRLGYYQSMTNKAAQALGRLGGQVKTKVKAQAARKNGALGGRPKLQNISVVLDYVEMGIASAESWLRAHPRSAEGVAAMKMQGKLAAYKELRDFITLSTQQVTQDE